MEKLAYTVKELTHLLGMCRESVYVEFRSGRLESFLVPKRKRRVSARALQAWVDAREAAMPGATKRKAG